MEPQIRNQKQLISFIAEKFHVYDQNQNGELDAREVEKLVNDYFRERTAPTQEVRSLSTQEIGILMSRLDTNGDGLVSKQEFLRMLSKAYKH